MREILAALEKRYTLKRDWKKIVGAVIDRQRVHEGWRGWMRRYTETVGGLREINDLPYMGIEGKSRI